LAHLRLRRGAEAAAEFQKILDDKGGYQNTGRPGAEYGLFYAPSYVGVARGAALAGDAARARKSYAKFFELWKDADPDIPILIEARREYATLQ
jgi:hypothetical protein